MAKPVMDRGVRLQLHALITYIKMGLEPGAEQHTKDKMLERAQKADRLVLDCLAVDSEQEKLPDCVTLHVVGECGVCGGHLIESLNDVGQKEHRCIDCHCSYEVEEEDEDDD